MRSGAGAALRSPTDEAARSRCAPLAEQIGARAMVPAIGVAAKAVTTLAMSGPSAEPQPDSARIRPTLIRRVTSMFMIFEDQIGVGDIVDTGMATGVVESVGIRVTQVRDLTGMLWSIRNGEIDRIGNGTRSWRKVVFDIALAPDTALSHADTVITTAISNALSGHLPPAVPAAVPECVGVVAFDGSAVTVRFTVEVPAADAYPLEMALRTTVRQAIIADPTLTLAAPLRFSTAL